MRARLVRARGLHPGKRACHRWLLERSSGPAYRGLVRAFGASPKIVRLTFGFAGGGKRFVARRILRVRPVRGSKSIESSLTQRPWADLRTGLSRRTCTSKSLTVMECLTRVMRAPVAVDGSSGSSHIPAIRDSLDAR